MRERNPFLLAETRLERGPPDILVPEGIPGGDGAKEAEDKEYRDGA